MASEPIWRAVLRGPTMEHSQPRNPCFFAKLGTIRGDNQPNTCPQSPIASRGWVCRSLKLGRNCVGFRRPALLRNPERNLKAGDGALATMLKEEVLVRSQAVVARVVAGETLIVPIRAKVGDLASIYSFNGTGSLIWKLLESPRTVAQLASAVAQAYEVEPAQAEKDVANFVSEMKSVGLVEVPASVAMAGD